MLPFFVSFEARKPQPRELVTIAVMAALAAASRAVFAFLPSFKPITAIIMITGIAFGAEAGFLTGALGIFASNFLFSQGPWTPWQMLAYGVAGFLAGLIFHRRAGWRKPLVLGIFGFFYVMLLIGPLLDCCTIFTPRHPKLRPSVQKAEQAEAAMDVDALVERAAAGVKLVKIDRVNY